MTPQELTQHAEVAATVSVSSASAGWLTWLAGANEILVTIATLIAIVSGVWALYDKIKARRGGDNDQADPSE